MRNILISLILLSSSVFAQEDIQINPDLQRSLDGRSQIDKLTDEQLSNIAKDSLLLRRMGVDASILKEALELKRKERDAIYDRKPARMLKEIITVSTDPGAPSPMIYTTPGHETLVNVIDQTGEPWPIVIASSGNNLLFETQPVEAHQYKNVFRLTSLERVGSSNITLLLQDKALSLTIRVSNSKDQYHPQPILQITESGPNAKQYTVRSRNVPLRNDQVMKKLMFNMAPDSFERLETSHPEVSAWKGSDGQLFLKTKLHPTYPEAKSIYRGPNGYSAYEIDSLPVLIMTDNNGVEHQVNILGE